VCGDDFGAGQAEKPLQPFAPRFALAALDHEGKLDPRHRGKKANARRLDRFVVAPLVGFVEQYGEDRRSIDHHQRHIPVSS
jgi:hypothetical protein